MTFGTIRNAALVSIVCLLIAASCSDSPTGSGDKESQGSSFELKIEANHGPDGKGILQGHYCDVKVTMDRSSRDIKLFLLVINYDTTALTFIKALPGYFSEVGNWQLFEYTSYSIYPYCDTACPVGIIRIQSAVDKTGRIQNYCFRPDTFPATLCTLRFLVKNDRSINCQRSPLRFYWQNCTDNSLIFYKDGSSQRVTVFESSSVFEYYLDQQSDSYVDISNKTSELPSWNGVPDDCPLQPGLFGVRGIDFKNGGIDIICSDSIDSRRDLDGYDGLGIGDILVYLNYFVIGLDAFGTHQESSIAASDINGDGVGLTLEDLQYLIRVIVGDGEYYQPPKDNGSCAVNSSYADGQHSFNYASTRNIGIIRLVCRVEGTVSDPIVAAHGMDVDYYQSGSTLKIVLYNIGSRYFPAGTGTLVTIPTNGKLTLDSASAADFMSKPMNVTIVPNRF